MLRFKVKVKKILFFYGLCCSLPFQAGVIHNTFISIAEQKVMGQNFKHVMTSADVEKDEFLINGRQVSVEKYKDELEEALKQELLQEQTRQENSRRSRIQFAEAMHVEITAKLLNKLQVQTMQFLDRVSNPALEKFLVFSTTTIDSYDQLMQLRLFMSQLESSIAKKISMHDSEGLNLLYNKLELWPMRLEKFFQDTVQNAIKKSDDTMMLKELLKLVSDVGVVI